MAAELTLPRLISIFLCDSALLIEDSLALSAELGVTSCHRTLVSKAVEGDLEHVCVKLKSILVDRLVNSRAFAGLVFLAEISLFGAHFAIRQVEVTTEVIRVHFFAGKVTID